MQAEWDGRQTRRLSRGDRANRKCSTHLSSCFWDLPNSNCVTHRVHKKKMHKNVGSTLTNMSTKNKPKCEVRKTESHPQGRQFTPRSRTPFPRPTPCQICTYIPYTITKLITCPHPLQYKWTSTTTANEWTDHTICVTRPPLTNWPLLTLKRLWGTLSHPQ